MTDAEGTSSRRPPDEYHLGGLDDQRGGGRGCAQAPDVREAPSSVCPTAQGPRGQGLIVSAAPATPPSRAAAGGTRTRSPSRVPASRRILAELPKTRPEGEPQVLREREAGASVPPPRRATMPPETSSCSPRHHAGPRHLRRRIGCHHRPLEPWCHRGDPRQHPPTPTASATTTARCDTAYSARTRHRGSSRCRASSSRRADHLGYVGGLSGCTRLGGADWTWHQPARRNDEISTRRGSRTCRARDALRGPLGAADYHVKFRNQQGELLAEADSWCFAPSATTRASRAPSTRR